MNIIIKSLTFLLFFFFSLKEESILILQYYDNKRLLRNLWQIYKTKYGIIYLISLFFLGFLTFFINHELTFFISFAILFIYILLFPSLKFKCTRRSLSILVIISLFLSFIFFLPIKLMNYTLLIVPFLSVICVMLCNHFEFLFELIIRKKYIKKAKNKLKKNKNRLIIAITGSYGKTSLKYYLSQILSYKFKVRASKGSVNTLMGLTKFINNEVEDYDEIIILEAGVDSLKGMDKILSLFTPDIGILTSIGEMHLATFKTKENIYFEKKKLLSASKVGYYCLDNDYLYQKKDDLNSFYNYSMNDFFSSIKRNENGLLITFKEKEILIPLYGIFTLSSLSAVIKIALSLGFSNDEIISILPNLKGERHRLEKKIINNMIVLDDAYNGNYEGIKEGIKTLSYFKGRKAIITPGIIELGKNYYDINYLLGKELINLDLVIIVSSLYTHPLKDGFIDNNGNIDKLIIVSDFHKGYEIVKKSNINALLIANDTFKTFIK